MEEEKRKKKKIQTKTNKQMPHTFTREIDCSLTFQGIIINREKKYFKDYEKYPVSLLLSRTTTNALVTELCEM